VPDSFPPAIGRYAIEGLIASGGMGEIYAARDPALNRRVAIKVLRDGFNDDVMRRRFEREARAAGSLVHPNVVTIYEFGERDGLPFIAMELVAGEPLSELIRRREPLSDIRRLQMMEGLCAGLAYAHRAGFVHRDIKPANLMVDGEGGLKILDFGIVHVAGGTASNSDVVVGTVRYMSPEQVTGASPIDYRSDIFAVGAVIYETFSYAPAFVGEHAQVLHAIVHREPEPILKLRPRLDPAIARAIARCMEKQPQRRYPDLTMLARELGRVRHRLEVEAAQERSGDTHPVTTSPGHGPAVDARPAEPPSPAAKRKILLDALLADAEAKLAAAEYVSAIVRCEAMLRIDPGDPRAREIRTRARQALGRAPGRE
jgi:eukaryotic-like serine/threonine-protein kinase